MGIFYIADMHIGHENVIKHDGRPFKDCKQMHRALIANWNNAVGANDEVYILGDFAWKSTIGFEVMSELAGKKHLILGNHDKPSQNFSYLFASIADYAVIQDGYSQVVLSHYPIAHWYNQYRGAVHLYGHVHNTKDYDAFQKYANICHEMNIPFESYNVGCMMPYMNYTPRTLTEIRKENGYEL